MRPGRRARRGRRRASRGTPGRRGGRRRSRRPPARPGGRSRRSAPPPARRRRRRSSSRRRARDRRRCAARAIAQSASMRARSASDGRVRHEAGVAPAQVHRAGVAQGGEAGMHLRREGPRQAAGRRVGRPEAGLGVALGQRLGDRERIPDGEACRGPRRAAPARCARRRSRRAPAPRRASRAGRSPPSPAARSARTAASRGATSSNSCGHRSPGRRTSRSSQAPRLPRRRRGGQERRRSRRNKRPAGARNRDRSASGAASRAKVVPLAEVAGPAACRRGAIGEKARFPSSPWNLIGDPKLDRGRSPVKYPDGRSPVRASRKEDARWLPMIPGRGPSPSGRWAPRCSTPRPSWRWREPGGTTATRRRCTGWSTPTCGSRSRWRRVTGATARRCRT